MNTTRHGLALTTLGLMAASLAASLAACGPAPSAPPAEPAPAAAASVPDPTELGDPVTRAILGSAMRAIQSRHTGAAIVLADEALSTTTADRTVCGRYIAIKNHWQGRRYFIASATELAVVENTSRRWVETCEGAKPVPGALTGPAVEAAVHAAAPQTRS